MFRRTRLVLARDTGTSTAEYAIGTLAAAAVATALYVVLSGDTVASALADLVQRALSVRT
ncbi:DUF4244 domain-containing protein [Umezawaea beigongshangensis]|uniref:DUF4244 domain-containing protein n=1 Tax=Umezawaea beigongshangensis TaxID=2780383 RepID=UPI0018F1A3A7|nr:DUF4244 domain-containing protein [Umezawaea beigongshangensis]